MSVAKKASKAPTWDLDSIFPGGSGSSKYAEFRKKIRSDLKKLGDVFNGLPRKLDDSSRAAWIEYIDRFQDLAQRVHHAAAFVGCLVSQNVDDSLGHQIQGETDVFRSELEKLMVSFEAFAKKQSDEQWKKLVTGDRLKEIQFFLNEVRDIAKLKMAPEFEYLAAELAVNGYHAWNRLYDKIYGDLRVKFTDDGKTRELSVGQLANKMSNPDRNIRRQAFEKLEEAWESRASEASMILNSQAGFRLSLYDGRKWTLPVFEPLLNCRIKQETLDAMWAAVKKSAPGIKKYIEAKKKLLGIKKFRWYDQTAPVGASDKTYTFDEAADLIIDILHKKGVITNEQILEADCEILRNCHGWFWWWTSDSDGCEIECAEAIKCGLIQKPALSQIISVNLLKANYAVIRKLMTPIVESSKQRFRKGK